MSRKLTLIVLLAVTLGLLGYDVYASVKGYEYTITAVIRSASQKHSAIPWIAGLLLGYWLGKAKQRMDDRKDEA